MPRTSEAAFNYGLGTVLRKKHPRWHDRIHCERTSILNEAALRPDLIIHHPGGLPVAVETEYVPALSVELDACGRLGNTLRKAGARIEQAIAVRIPDNLAQIQQDQLEEAIEKADLEFCVLSGNPEEPYRYPLSGWINGGVNDLAECVELAALSENQIALGTEILEKGIDQAANFLRDECVDAPYTLKMIAAKLHQEDGDQTSRMAMAILTNALTFHLSIAGAHDIPGLDELRQDPPYKRRILDVWQHILKNVNYWPIFKIASDVLLPIRSGVATKLLEKLSGIAMQLDEMGMTSKHDLCGRMFQRLITDRKFLATFYTLPSSAALLAELAIDRLDIDWFDREAVTSLRVGDFACGTGALLYASYGAILSRYRRGGKDDSDIHPEMMERALVGADIMPAATHLTASILSSAHPSVPFTNTSILTLPYGKQPIEHGEQLLELGSLELMLKESTKPIFGTGRKRMRGIEKMKEGKEEQMDIPHKTFDIVIMNPPFTRPTNHKITDVPVPSFAGFSNSGDEQREMSKRLKSLSRKVKSAYQENLAGHGNAGLASNFLDIAHVKLKSPGGVLAIVLPASFLQGESWTSARELLRRFYKDIMIISIADTGATMYAFSADTNMAEVLVVATRREDPAQENGKALFVNLRHRPETILEAKDIARSVRWQRLQADLSGVTATDAGSEQAIANIIRGSMSETGCAGIRDAEVAKAAIGLAEGELSLPRHQKTIPLRTVRLGDLGERGLLHRDISGKDGKSSHPRGPFDIVDLVPSEVPTWPALWAHKASRERRMTVSPDSQGQARQGCDGRATKTWKATASRLHFSLDFSLASQSLAACLTPDLSIGGRAWPNFLCTEPRWETPLVLWANTIFGLVSMWWTGSRQQTGRAILTISRLETLVTLDARHLTKAQLDRAEVIFDDFQNRELLPASQAWKDDARQALDRAVLVDLLELPEDILEPLDLLRKKWCAEPSVHGGRKTAIIFDDDAAG